MKRILLIDDEEIANYLSELILKKLGMFDLIDICTSAKDGLALLGNLQEQGTDGPGMILLDINMPVMNGYGFLDEFDKMSDAFKQKIKIIILTSSLNEKDRARAMEYKNVADFCNKPLSIDMMKQLVEKYYPADVA